ncbi:MAG TPA: cytidine deaminase [Verrucomicrobiae bacterium]|nr:cytidine deaminase [Verrucomicrobiae bacterium]
MKRKHAKPVAAVYDRRPKRGPKSSARTERRFNTLIAAAKAVQKNAHAPYSKFRVGAALLAKNGKVYTGVNVENASYGLTNCAERGALGKAVSDGQRKFAAIAVVAPSSTLSPCGACRQALAEFGDMVVVCADSRNLRKQRVYRVSELLPHAFKL